MCTPCHSHYSTTHVQLGGWNFICSNKAAAHLGKVFRSLNEFFKENRDPFAYSYVTICSQRQGRHQCNTEVTKWCRNCWPMCRILRACYAQAKPCGLSLFIVAIATYHISYITLPCVVFALSTSCCQRMSCLSSHWIFLYEMEHQLLHLQLFTSGSKNIILYIKATTIKVIYINLFCIYVLFFPDLVCWGKRQHRLGQPWCTLSLALLLFFFHLEAHVRIILVKLNEVHWPSFSIFALG